MSIASEISRIQSAKTAIAAAIEDKGVTVPSGTKIDGFADLIGDIETGGGGGTVLVPTAGDYPVVVNADIGRATTTSLASTGISITIPVSGTYRLKWSATRTNSSTSYTWGTQLYRTRNNVTSAIGTENTSWTSTYMQSNSIDVACEAGDVITIYAQARSTSYIVSAGGLAACVAQKMWTN